jgi:hypothetical protein
MVNGRWFCKAEPKGIAGNNNAPQWKGDAGFVMVKKTASLGARFFFGD